MNETLNEHVIMLAQQREYLEELDNKVSMAIVQLELTDEAFQLEKVKIEYDKARRMETILSQIARVAALEAFEQTFDDKKPHPATQIKEYKIVIIDDESAAKKWASENVPSTLSLNKSKFNKVAKELEVDFVHNEIEYRAQVSKDLSDYVD